MLILSRKVEEKILIGDHIVITIVQLNKDMVKLGFEAPREVEIHHQEVYDKIQRLRGVKPLKTKELNKRIENERDGRTEEKTHT